MTQYLLSRCWRCALTCPVLLYDITYIPASTYAMLPLLHKEVSTQRRGVFTSQCPHLRSTVKITL